MVNSILSLLPLIWNRPTMTPIAKLHLFSYWVLVLILVFKSQALLTGWDSKQILLLSLWDKVKDKLLKELSKILWVKVNGFFYKTATWLLPSCLNSKEFFKMLRISTKISEFGWLVCLPMFSLLLFSWRESRWLINLQED